MTSIVFMGTPEFSIPSLEKLNSSYDVRAVVTVPDKPQGRGKIISPSPVKIKAIELGIPVLQPVKLIDSEFIENIKNINPDIICVIAFRILPKEIFTLSKIASFNIHASLLPKYRGAAPINWAIIKGEHITGLTSFILDEKVDTGNILLQKLINISDNMIASELHDLMAPQAASLAVETIECLISDSYKLLPQDSALATPAPKIYPIDCKINWNQYAFMIKHFIHGLSYYPGAWTYFIKSKMKLLRVEAVEELSFKLLDSELIPNKLKIGEYVIDKNNFIVKCGSGFILIKELQPEGKKPMEIESFINGFRGVKKGLFD